MKLKPGRLHVSVDDHDGLISIQDAESMKGFWLLMSQRTGLDPTTATLFSAGIWRFRIMISGFKQWQAPSRRKRRAHE